MSQMPPKYRLDDVSFVVGDRLADVPCVAGRWLDINIGQTVGVAPHGQHSVRLGVRVPRWITEVRVTRAHAVESVRVRLRQPSLGYLGATEGDTLVATRNDDEIVIRLAEVSR